MKFDVFEKMYELLWECIYNIFVLLNIDIANPYKKDEEAAQ